MVSIPEGRDLLRFLAFLLGEGMNHFRPQKFVIEVLRHGEEHLQPFVGAVTKPRQELPVVLEIDARHLRDAEDKLPMRDGVKDVVGHILPKLNRPLGMATGAEDAFSGVYVVEVEIDQTNYGGAANVG